MDNEDTTRKIKITENYTLWKSIKILCTKGKWRRRMVCSFSAVLDPQVITGNGDSSTFITTFTPIGPIEKVES
jgi:hypothetical protein